MQHRLDMSLLLPEDTQSVQKHLNNDLFHCRRGSRHRLQMRICDKKKGQSWGRDAGYYYSITNRYIALTLE